MATGAAAGGPPTDLNDGKIQFVQHFLPAIEDGDYNVSLTQDVKEGDTLLDHYDSTFEFSVGGPRFSLQAADLAAAFPPAGCQGDYANALPHLVFHKKTLPWERQLSPDFKIPQPPHEDDVPSWVAILVFHQSELPRITYRESGTVADITTLKPAGVFSYPGLLDAGGQPALERGQSVTDPLKCLDIPLDLFHAIAPSVEDLKVLAHGRTVNAAAKADSQLRGAGALQDYSVVTANRMPATGDVASGTEAHLVSLEGLAEFLPADGTYENSAKFPAGTSAIRLVSLYKWSFVSLTPSETFREYLSAVSAGPLTLPPSKTPPSTTAESAVAAAMERGYVPLRHETRNGQTKVSWYRGPLAPFAVNDSEGFPKEHPDALMRYDPGTGMFDVSYAAAWQLGQLLGLSEKGYARDLYQYRKRVALDTVRQLEIGLMEAKWPDLLAANSSQLSSADLHHGMFTRLSANHLANAGSTQHISSGGGNGNNEESNAQ